MNIKHIVEMNTGVEVLTLKLDCGFSLSIKMPRTGDKTMTINGKKYKIVDIRYKCDVWKGNETEIDLISEKENE